MKTKKTKTKVQRKPRAKKENYPAHYLAIILMSAMVLEGVLFGATAKADWTHAGEVLDVSEQVSQTAVDMSLVFQPIVETVSGVNEFYKVAAAEFIPLLDMKDSFNDVALIWDGVNAFYEEASVQMSQVLDVTSVQNWPAAIAGVSVEN